jgi:hypothetical protein
VPLDREGTLRKAEKLLRQGKLDLAIAEYRAVRALPALLELQAEAGEHRDTSTRLEQLKVQMGS